MKPITASWTNPGWIYARYLLGSVCVRVSIIVCSYNLKLRVFTKTQPSKRNWNSTYTCRIQKHPQNTVLIVTLIKQQCIIYALIFLSKKTVMVLLTTTEKIDLFFLDYIVKFCLPEACWSCSNTSWSKRARRKVLRDNKLPPRCFQHPVGRNCCLTGLLYLLTLYLSYLSNPNFWIA